MFNERQLSLLKKLTDAKGISGYEKNISRIFKQELEEIKVPVNYDRLGSIFGVLQGSSPLKVMLAGHMDEVGFIIKEITDQGFIMVHPIGGWWPHVLLGQRMTITTRDNVEYTGVFGGPAPHGMTVEERGKVVDIKNLYLDIGAVNSQEVADAGIRIGDMITPQSQFQQLINKNRVMAKAFDDRIGVFIALEVARELASLKVPCPNTFYPVGTVQEEVGLRGAKTAAFMIKPDLAIAIDVTITGDMPNVKPDGKALGKLGKGIALSLADSSVIGHSGLLQYLEDIAKELKLPFTYDVLAAGGTDSGEIHKTDIGVPTVTISIPSRYIHSHNSIIDLQDVENVIKLLVALLSRLTPDLYKRILETNQ